MSEHRAPRPRTVLAVLRSVRLRAALSLGLVVGLGTTGTLAFWTDTATVQGGSFTAGRLDVRVGDPAVDNNPPAFATSFALANMVPGSSKDAVLRISNADDVPFTFRVDGTATNNGAAVNQLGSALRLSVFPSSSSATACSGTPIVTNVVPTGAVLGEQPLLAAGATRDVCFRATLPTTAATELQGQSSVVTLTVTATQG